MEDRKIFLGSNLKYISKTNTKKFQNLKRLHQPKIFIKTKFLYLIIIILLILVILLFAIIFFQNKKFSSLYQNPDDFIYYNTSEMDEPKNLFEYKEDHTEIKDKEKIRICYCIDNNLVYPTLVSMTSALENNNKDKNVLIF